jgi:hypothetical protein
MSNRTPLNFNWGFKNNIRMTPEEHQNMLNQDPELNALIQINNQDQDENVAQNNDTLEEFDYNGKLRNNHELEDGDSEGNSDLL